MAKLKWKRTGYGGVYAVTPSGEKIYIERSMDNPKLWESGGQYFERIAEAKSQIQANIDDGGKGYKKGGLAKKYVNSVKIVNHL